MDFYGINAINSASTNIDFFTIQKILTSQNISDSKKIKFINDNKPQIERMVKQKISSPEFQYLMKNRKLEIFKPLKNSYTKRGDKILLAQTLNIPVSEVERYIEDLSQELNDLKSLKEISPETINIIKTYVYRHGKKEQLLAFLDNELSDTQSILNSLYNTLSYNTGGVADYFARPIHHLDNHTMFNIYNIIDKNLHSAKTRGLITEPERTEAAQNALIQIYYIQNNQRFLNALKLKRALS